MTRQELDVPREVPCANCEKTYVGETGSKLGVEEHKTECEPKTKRAFTRSQRTASLAEIDKSALTDHAKQENHTINWSRATVIDREPDRLTRLIKDAIYIPKEGAQSTKAAINSVTHTTDFLARQVQVLVVPRTGRTSTSFFF